MRGFAPFRLRTTGPNRLRWHRPATDQPRSAPGSQAGPFHGLAALTLALGATLSPAAAPPVRAGSVTAESVWGAKNALQRAMEQVPRGATVIRRRCGEISVGTGNYRDRCTVWYSDVPEPAAP